MVVPNRKTIKRRPANMRCRAIDNGTKRDAEVQQCQKPITFVTVSGRMLPEDPGTRDENDSLAYWSIFCATHRGQRNADRAADIRDKDDHRDYGPQRILKGQTSDIWVDPVEGGNRWSSNG